LDADLSKEMKKAPAIEFEIPKKIFTKHDAESGAKDNLVMRLVDFN
jgi:U3 small nucleolar RNA-associated protein 19